MMVFEGPEVGAVDEGHPIAIERAKDRQGYLSKRRERSGSSSSSSTLSPVNLDEDKDWLDVEPDYEETTFRSLVDEAQFTDILSMLDHVKEISSIDFLATCRTFGTFAATLSKGRRYHAEKLAESRYSHRS